jgi:hypothetical protein
MPKRKRPRGGQPGNQNARKHGFYTNHLTEPELAEFRKLINEEKLDPEIAVIRTKVTTSLLAAPGNRRILVEGAHRLSEWFIYQHDLNGSAASLVNRYWRNLLTAAVTGDVELTKRIGSETIFQADKLQHELDSKNKKPAKNNKTKGFYET